MTKLLIAFIGGKKNGGIHFDNIVLKVSNPKLSPEDIDEIKECIAHRHKLVSVVILNIMELGTEGTNLIGIGG